jgi:hypothetical protein
MYEDYENFRNTTKGYTSLGDEVVRICDYKSMLWDFDYSRTRREVVNAMKRAKTKRDRNILMRYLASLDNLQHEETKKLGLAIWVLRTI